jgi:hypothetical protein
LRLPLNLKAPNTAWPAEWEIVGGQGGWLWATGVGGSITGKGWGLGLIDDPIKNAEDTASDVIRAKQQDWYSSTFYTREEPWSDTDQRLLTPLPTIGTFDPVTPLPALHQRRKPLQ